MTGAERRVLVERLLAMANSAEPAVLAHEARRAAERVGGVQYLPARRPVTLSADQIATLREAARALEGGGA